MTHLDAPCLDPIVLASVARLTHLTLDCLPDPAAFVHVPQLTRLTLSEAPKPLRWGEAREPLPPGFLAPVPRLTHLTLRLPQLEAWPSDLLAYTPDLIRLELQSAPLRALSPAFLAPVPRLTHLALRLEVPPPAPAVPQPLPSPLPPAFLAPVPQLTHLALECAPRLPPDFLVPVPRLTHLTLCFGYHNRESLPFDFLAPVPRLTHLTLDAIPGSLPPDFLAFVPRLTHLTGAVPHSPHALKYVPRLTHVVATRLSGDAFVRDWGDQSFAYTPHLTYVRLDYFGSPHVPSNFLPHAPHLKHLSLLAPFLQTLPSDFLAHAPRLERLDLFAPALRALPTGFLAHAPRLTHLDLHHLSGAIRSLRQLIRLSHEEDLQPALTTLPPDFLAHAPRLAYLNLPVRRLAQVPLQVQEHLRARGTLAVVDVPWGHVHFPTGDPGFCARPALRYPIVDGERDVWFASAVGVVFACPETPAWQPAPQTLCRPPAPLGVFGITVGDAASGFAASVAWVDGLVVALHAQPNRRSAVTGHACRGDVVRIEARYGDDAWLRVRLVDQFFFPGQIRHKSSGRYTRIYWMPATAVRPWLPEDPIPVGCPFRG